MGTTAVASNEVLNGLNPGKEERRWAVAGPNGKKGRNSGRLTMTNVKAMSKSSDNAYTRLLHDDDSASIAVASTALPDDGDDDTTQLQDDDCFCSDREDPLEAN